MDKTVLPSTTLVNVRFLSDAIVVTSIDEDVIEDLDEEDEEEDEEEELVVVEEDVLAYWDLVCCIDLLDEERDEDEDENGELVDDGVLIM